MVEQLQLLVLSMVERVKFQGRWYFYYFLCLWWKIRFHNQSWILW